MDADSPDENNINHDDYNSPIEEPKKPKRQMKTPYQLEILENTYALEPYPSEATRSELSEKLNLTDRQLQMWFCHRRLKEKKDGTVKQQQQQQPVQATGKVRKRESFDNPNMDLLGVGEGGSDHGSESGSGPLSQLGPGSDSGSDGSTNPSNHYANEAPIPNRYYETPESLMSWKVIGCVELQLGEPIRKDGPILGMEFDDPPPGAFGVPRVMADGQDRSRKDLDHKSSKQRDAKTNNNVRKGPHEYASEGIGMEIDPNDHHVGSSSMNSRGNEQLHRAYRQPNHHQMDYYHISQRGSTSADAQMGVLSMAHPHETHITSSEDGSAMDKNRKTDEGRSGRIESSEKRIRKELEKQDNMRRRMEEAMRREMERQDRDRLKEEEKQIREKQRQDERFQRENKREIERREKFLQRELIRAEKIKQKEELRIERELVKQRIAMERATARKIAKESMELIEDERLELMELAALKKGLPAITSLDHDTLQNLELFREFLIQFPPKSVQLKKPFAISPWIDSDENIGNLLMVWGFCITFADAMGIWPFTLDELVQAFHEYDSRLLGEIHISLLKLVIMDIENVSRTSSVSVGATQIAASSNPDGGHPHVVDGAYKWGFDIRNWKKHLGPMSWPEILRQFALSAGFGPKLKKKGVVGKTSLPDEEAKGCEDAVTSLRNGVAAEKAAAQMQGKGFASQKKSRHRLTPGTLKYAAYSVLSLEGSEGLTVIKLAQKVQEFGLRNLSTSKTPEASISVALSRDTVLFERTAPSTYRVRTPFRKDPVDAESILSAAREKINRYENGFSNERNSVDVEKDESEGDGEEIAEVEDVDTLDTAKDRSCQADFTMSCGTENKNLSMIGGNLMSESLEASLMKNPEQGCTEIDESKSGEPWVLGLTEGEYSDLPVQERLNALVALIGIVNEGNSIRAVIEDRFENTGTLKKQMLAEAQLDKKRIKEEGMSKSHHASSMGEDEIKQDNINNIPQDENLVNSFQSICNILHGQATERARLGLKSYIGQKAEETYAYRALPLGQDRRRNRYWKFGASASVHDPGSGRIFVESPTGQWRVLDSEEAFDALLTSLDSRGIRESHLQIMLREIEQSFRKNIKNICLSSEYENGICTKAEIDTNPACSGGDLDSPQSMGSGSISNASDELSTSFRIQLGRNEAEKIDVLNRYKEFQLWMWRECFNTDSLCAKKSVEKRSTKPVLEICGYCLDLFVASDELLCPCCDRPFVDSLTYFDQEPKGEVSNASNFVQPVRIALLKVLLTYIEFSLPSEALLPSWTENNRRMEWGMQLHKTSSIEGLLQALTVLESVIQRDYLSKTFDTTEELLASYSSLGNSGSLVQLPWMPQTTAAIAMRLLDLDGSICYTSDLTEFIASQIIVEPNPIVVLEVKQGKRAGTSVPRGGSKKRAVRVVKSNCKPAKQDYQVLTPVPIQQAMGVERIGTGPRTVRKKRPLEDTKLGQDNVFDCRSGSSLNYNSSPEDDGEEPNDYSSMEEPLNNHGIIQDIPMDEDDKSSSESDESDDDDDDKVIYPAEEEEEEEGDDDAFEGRRDGTIEANGEDEDSSDSEDESDGYSD